MKVERLIALMVMATILTGCADRDASVDTGNIPVSPVNVSLSFSMPAVSGASGSQTRMADEVVQTDPAKYRGLKDVHMIPFTVSGKITKDDVPTVKALNNPTDEGRVDNAVVTNAAFYRYPSCEFSPSTASVLFYAKGANTATVGSTTILATDKAFYGSTLATGFDNGSLSAIKFKPEQIYPSEVIDAKAQALANYLTAIANTTGWSTTNDPKLKALYLNFIHMNNEGNYALIAGSSVNIKVFVEELYAEAGKYESDPTTADAIRASIATGADITGGVVTALKDGLKGYPANIGLPDGAAAMQWNASQKEFVPQVKTTIETDITSIDRFVYPAELCYYGNSTLRTSNTEVNKAVYENATDWLSVLELYNSGATVSENTKSIALVDAVQYGVARLSVKLKKMDLQTNPLKDAHDEKVKFSDDCYPLTAVIVGGQYPVGFDFRPETVQPWPAGSTESAKLNSEVFFAYDSQVKTNKSSGTDDYYYMSRSGDTGNTNTLLLQTYKDKNVRMVLEFENKSGEKFMGHDGIVYPGTKFYLVGEVNPETATAQSNKTEENQGRVFTQDYTTTFEFQIESFKNAYNVMPDLLAPRMEIGVKVANWETIRPTIVELQQ